MSFPQTRADREVLASKDFWRLRTPLDSSGDIYELDTSARAFTIGPQSDVPQARVTYFDPQQPGAVQDLIVSIDAPFIGRIDALLDEAYPTTGGGGGATSAPSAARAFISPVDIIQNAYRPQFLIAGENLFYPQPQLDFITYLSSEPAGVPAKREAKEYRLLVPIAGGGPTNSAWFVIPHYGRKYFAAVATAVPPGYEMRVSGINLRAAGASSFTETYVPSAVFTPISLGATVATTIEVKASLHGFFDLIQVEIKGAPTLPGGEPFLNIIQSDEVI